MNRRFKMQYLITGEMARQIDAYTIHKSGVPSLVLMERASLAVAEECERMVQGEKKSRILAVCGTGNNGGDGIAAARILFARGYKAEILLAGDAARLSEDAAAQLKIAAQFGVPVQRFVELSNYDILIDALFGTGLSREVTGRYEILIDEMNRSGCRVCAVDIASGVHAGTGKILGTAVNAEVTVTFGDIKLGMVLYPGALKCGRAVCAEIGFDPNARAEAGMCYFAPGPEDLEKIPKRYPDSHKGSYGKVLTIAGSRNMAGAAAFSASAAYRTGAGLVTVLTPECNREILQTLVPEAVMKTYGEDAGFPEGFDGMIAAATVVVIGPGLGLSETAQQLVHGVIQSAQCPVIMDADALNILAQHPDWMEEMRDASQQNSKACFILTPHKMELSRLTGDNIQSIQENIIQVCVAFSRKYGVILVAKDARTLVSDGTGNIYVNTSGNDGMSCGGSGDVLTGIIAALAAQGSDPLTAAWLGVYLHGLAGDAAAEKKGHYGMTAGDIVKALPDIIRRT